MFFILISHSIDYNLRTINRNQFSQSEQEILSVLQDIPPDTISFSQQWVLRFLQLFGAKQEISLFWTFFSQILVKNTLRSDKNINQEIDLQQEVLAALANHNQQYAQNNSMYNGSQMGQLINEDWAGLSGLCINSQDFTQNFSQIPKDTLYLQEKSQFDGSQTLSQKGSNKSAEDERTGPGIIPKALRQKLRSQFQYYRDTQQQFINIGDIAKKNCISEVALGRLIKKWSYQPQFKDYLNKIQSKQQLWHIKTPYFKQIQAWGKKIEEILYRNPYLSLAELGQRLRLSGSYKIPQESQLKQILSAMKYVRKRVGTNEVGRNTHEIMHIRKKYCEIYQNIIKKKQIVVFFLDQYRFDNQFHPEYGWVKEGQYVPPVVSKSNMYVSLVVLLSQNFSFNYKTYINQGNPQPNLGPTILSLIQQVAQKVKQKQVVVITTSPQMSNPLQPAHIGKQNTDFSLANITKEAIYRYGWNLMILPPKSNQLNPLVSFFKEIKDQMKKLSLKCTDLKELEQKLKEICPTLEYFEPNFEQVIKYASKGILGCKF